MRTTSLRRVPRVGLAVSDMGDSAPCQTGSGVIVRSLGAQVGAGVAVVPRATGEGGSRPARIGSQSHAWDWSEIGESAPRGCDLHPEMSSAVPRVGLTRGSAAISQSGTQMADAKRGTVGQRCDGGAAWAVAAFGPRGPGGLPHLLLPWKARVETSVPRVGLDQQARCRGLQFRHPGRGLRSPTRGTEWTSSADAGAAGRPFARMTGNLVPPQWCLPDLSLE